MTSLLSRLAASRTEKRYSVDDWLTWQGGQFSYGGASYPYGVGLRLTLQSNVETIHHDFGGYVRALKTCPPAFAAELVRSAVLSEIRFVWRNHGRDGRPAGRLWSNGALAPLEVPWTNGTTGELVSKMEWHAGAAGNAYVYRNRTKQRLQVLRPDWVSLVFGSESEPDDPIHALDADLLGYVYVNGGLTSGNKPVTLLPEDVAHWSPLPDPEGGWIGMSWLTPAVREIMGDQISTEHKLNFFRQGATPNLVVKGIPATTVEQFNEWVDILEERHTGVRNAYRTLYLTAGADATVVGSNLKDLDLKSTQGSFETRIASLSRVPAAILQISEGMQGSALNSAFLGQTRRLFGDSFCYPTWRSLCASLDTITDSPSDSDLWFDPTDVAFLRDDAGDLADIRQKDMNTIRAGVDAGFDPDAVVTFTDSGDLSQLLGTHSGLFSVQLQPAGADGQPVRVQVAAADLARLGELFPNHRVTSVEPVKTA